MSMLSDFMALALQEISQEIVENTLFHLYDFSDIGGVLRILSVGSCVWGVVDRV